MPFTYKSTSLLLQSNTQSCKVILRTEQQRCSYNWRFYNPESVLVPVLQTSVNLIARVSLYFIISMLRNFYYGFGGATLTILSLLTQNLSTLVKHKLCHQIEKSLLQNPLNCV